MKIVPILGSKMSGSIAGVTASHNAGGMYLRSRVTPVNANTPQQQAVRNALSSLVSNWQSLTSSAQSSWANYAANVPVTDRVGASIHLSGQQMYIRCNTPRVQVGLTPLVVAPTAYNTGPLTPPVLVTMTGLTGILSFTFNASDGWATAVGGSLLVYVSRPTAKTINYFKGPYQFAGRVNGAVSPPSSPASVVAPFAVPASTKVWVQMRASYADGRLSSPWRGGIIAV